MYTPIELAGLAAGETAYLLSLSDTDATDTAYVVVRAVSGADPRVVTVPAPPALRVDAYQVDAQGLAIDGGGGLVGPPTMYIDLSHLLTTSADPAAQLAGIIESQCQESCARMRSYLLARRALTALPEGGDLPL